MNELHQRLWKCFANVQKTAEADIGAFLRDVETRGVRDALGRHGENAVCAEATMTLIRAILDLAALAELEARAQALTDRLVQAAGTSGRSTDLMTNTLETCELRATKVVLDRLRMFIELERERA